MGCQLTPVRKRSPEALRISPYVRNQDAANYAALEEIGRRFEAMNFLTITYCNNWRSGPESNRHTRICSPMHHHSATGPQGGGHHNAWPAGYIGHPPNAVKRGAMDRNAPKLCTK